MCVRKAGKHMDPSRLCVHLSQVSALIWPSKFLRPAVWGAAAHTIGRGTAGKWYGRVFYDWEVGFREWVSLLQRDFCQRKQSIAGAADM